MKAMAIVICMFITLAAIAQEKKMESKKMENKAVVLHGIVVDQMCAKSMAKKSNPMERAAKHDKDCAVEEACAASGYGLFYDNGKWVKFDENGDKLAKKMFDTSEKNNDFVVNVKGEMKDDRFAVASLTESKMMEDEKMTMKKEGSHDMHK